MSSPNIDYPLPAWPAEVYPYEPAHGYFRRLAKANSHLSTRVMADIVGVKGRHIVHQELLDFCLQFPSAHASHLEWATPIVEGQLVNLSGQTFHKQLDHGVYRPKVCLRCLDEEPHYRNWFDLKILRHCPIHNCVFTTSGEDGEAAFWQTEIAAGRSPSGYRSAGNIGTWEVYVLGRLGVMDPVSNIWLDEAPLHEIIQAAVVLGGAKEAGWAKSNPHSKTPRADLTALGFEVLQAGEAGIREFFLELGRQGGVVADRGRLTFGVAKAFGWIAASAVSQPENVVWNLVRTGLRSAAHSMGIYSRKGRTAVASMPGSHITLNDLARLTALGPVRTRRVAERLGIIQRELPKTQCHSFSPDDVATVRAAIYDAVDRSVAADLFGLSRKDFDPVGLELGLKPLVRIGSPGRISDRFLRSELEAALRSIKDEVWPFGAMVPFAEFCERSSTRPSTIAIRIIRGDQSVGGWSDAPGFQGAMLPTADLTVRPLRKGSTGQRSTSTQPGLSFADAAAILDASPSSVRCLVAIGKLKPVSQLGVGARPRLDAESVWEFRSRFAPARAFAEVLNMPMQRISAEIAGAHVMTLNHPDLDGNLWIDRRHVVEVLGRGWDLAARTDPHAEEFWNGLRNFLTDSRSATRLVGGFGSTARLRSGEGDGLGKITIDRKSRAVTLEFEANANVSFKRFEVICRQLEQLKTFWPAGTVEGSNSVERISVRQTFRVGDEAQDIWLANVFERISFIATELRFLVRGRGSTGK